MHVSSSERQKLGDFTNRLTISHRRFKFYGRSTKSELVVQRRHTPVGA